MVQPRASQCHWKPSLRVLLVVLLAKSPEGWGRGQHEGQQGAHPLWVVGWETKKGGGREKEADACCPQHPAWPEQTFKCLVKCSRVHLTAASSREHQGHFWGHEDGRGMVADLGYAGLSWAETWPLANAAGRGMQAGKGRCKARQGNSSPKAVAQILSCRLLLKGIS